MNKSKKIQTTAHVKVDIESLLEQLTARTDQSPQLQDIQDVLGQVYKKIDHVDNPEALVNRLVNYIRVKSSNGKIHYPKNQEDLLMDLSWIGAKAGWNGLYMADFSDKSQFYSILEPMPRR
jgi:hypothetical protein